MNYKQLVEQARQRVNASWPDAGTKYEDLDFWGDGGGHQIGTCWHDWKRYVGFTETYDYCESCQEKREIKNERK